MMTPIFKELPMHTRLAAVLLLASAPVAFADDCRRQLDIEGMYEMHSSKADAALQISNCEDGMFDVVLHVRAGDHQSGNETSTSFRGQVSFEENRGLFRSEDNDCNMVLNLGENRIEMLYPSREGDKPAGANCLQLPIAGHYQNLMLGLPTNDESSF